MAFIEFKNLHTWFYTDAGIVKAVNGVDFEIRKGETVCVVGESGCGKSVTSLSLMHLVQSPPGKIVDGEILMDGRDLLKLSKSEMEHVNGKDVAMIFQEPMNSLNPCMRYRCNKRRSKSKSSGNDKTGWYSESGRNHGMLSSRAFRWYASAYHDCNGSGM